MKEIAPRNTTSCGAIFKLYIRLYVNSWRDSLESCCMVDIEPLLFLRIKSVRSIIFGLINMFEDGLRLLLFILL